MGGSNYYNSIAEGYNMLHEKEQENKLSIILNEINIKKKDKLLDVGCATGNSFKSINCDCYGIDPSIRLLEKCQKKVRLYLGRAEDLPFPDNYFDIVISITAIHNFANVKAGIKEMKRVGKSIFAFSVLKKSKKFAFIEKTIIKNFNIINTVDEGVDKIYIASGKKYL
ncbi:MAG: class I SAM-dependent methyltransferase [archaeon]